ncbi:MAG: hypothetical protein LJE83_05565, partial [Gammaproteobacteria bacterium]|nr:hypothetical protein [Gammaproteobacteria bacterium]
MSAQNQDNDEVLTTENEGVKTREQDKLEDIHAAEERLEDEHAGEEKLESPEKNADSLEAQLESAQKKASENWDMYLRAVAEMDNLRR